MKKFMLISFLFVSMVFGSSDVNSVQYDFNFTKSKKATAYVNWNAQTIELEVGEKRIRLPGISKDMMDYKAFISESIFFGDLNFDGYTDVGVTVGIGYGGVNICMDYYFYDPKQDQFHKYLKNICNLEIKKNTKILASHMKSGAGYAHEYYQINEKGRPSLFLLGMSSWTDSEENDLKIHWSAESVSVKAKRAYFYDNWDGKRSETYMVKGDRVKVLAIESTKGVYWVKVAYKGKKKTFKQWVKLSDLAFEEIIVKEDVTFVVMGDMPYTAKDKITLKKLSVAIPALHPSVLVHYGDLKSGGESCTDELLKERRDQFHAYLPHRVIYTPGDNEWTDCDRKYLIETYDELERLAYLRKIFYKDKALDLSQDIPYLSRQKEQPENSMWKIEGLLMGTLHIVGTNNGRVNILKSDVNQTLDAVDRRDDLNRVWLRKLFEKAKEAEGFVVIFHADIYRFKGDAPACTLENRLRCNPYKNIRDDIEAMALEYKKPVLVVHGDTNAYCFNQQSEKIPNLWHFNGPGDFKVSDAAKITFHPDNTKRPFEVTGVLNVVQPPLICNYNR